jgi:DNA-binding transcriptional ArsR family regulator
MSAPLSTTDLLQGVAEPTRLRILNSLTAVPLFVSDLQAILDLPQPTVSRHLKVLRDLGLVRDTPVGQFVLYRVRRPDGPIGRLLGSVLDTASRDPALRRERQSAIERSRRQARARQDEDLEGRTA